VPCYLCEDIPCAAACPTDALDLVGLTDEDGELDVSKSRMVDADYCTGCGLCEYACVTEEPAILVLPRDVALGKAGEHYELPPPKFMPEEPSDEI